MFLRPAVVHDVLVAAMCTESRSRFARSYVRCESGRRSATHTGDVIDASPHISGMQGHRSAPHLAVFSFTPYLVLTTPPICSPHGVHSGRRAARFRQAGRRKAALPFSGYGMRTRVYVDGFNPFYGALSGGPYKWLDLFPLFQHHVLAPDAIVDRVNYYTAPIRASAADDSDAAGRQQRYLRALEQFRPGLVTIRRGRIQRSTPALRLAEDAEGLAKGTPVRVLQFTEKQTHVDLAADLISDAWRGRFEQAVVCSNDSDLTGALEAIRRDHPAIRVGLIAPLVRGDARMISADLKNLAHWRRRRHVRQFSAGDHRAMPARLESRRGAEPASP